MLEKLRIKSSSYFTKELIFLSSTFNSCTMILLRVRPSRPLIVFQFFLGFTSSFIICFSIGPLFSIASIAMFRPRTAGFHLVSGGSRPLDNGGRGRGGGGGHPDPEIRGCRVSKKLFPALRTLSLV